MWNIDFRPLIWGLIIIGALVVAILWGAWELIDWLWIDHSIRVSKPLTPEVLITIKNGVADTVYIYKLP